MLELDPFTQVFDALWQLADDSEPLRELVRAGNMIRYNQLRDRSPAKKEILDADLPELRLVTVGSQNPNLHSTSNSSEITRTYAWQIATGDQRANARLFPVEFAVFAAMTQWQTVLTALTWNDYHFVKDANVSSVTDRLTDSDQNKGIFGWLAVWTIRVRMVFPTLDLIEYNQPTS